MNMERLRAWEARIDELSLRERAILLLTSVLLLGALMHFALLRPVWTDLQTGRTEIRTLQTRLEAITLRSHELQTGRTTPELERRRRIEQLEAQLRQREAGIQARLGRVMRPEQAAQLLQELLQQTQGLELVRLETQSGTPVLGGQSDSAGMAAGVGRYNLSLEMQGDFRATVRYLEQVEKLPWKLFWDSLEYEVEEHPMSMIKLNIFTLGQL